MKINLKTIIAEFISSADLSEHQFMRLWHIAVRGKREFGMDVTGRFKTEVLEVSANKTVELPEDYLSFSKLGILNASGQVVTFRQNPNLSTVHEEYANSLKNAELPPAINFNSPTRFPFLWFNFSSDTGGYHLYGLGSGTESVGEYRIDEDCRTIFLSSDWPCSHIVLEYLSDGFDCEQQDYLIDERASEAMIAYIRWKNAQDNRKKFSTGDVQYFKREYYNQKRLAKIRLNPVNIAEMQAIFRSSIKLVARA